MNLSASPIKESARTGLSIEPRLRKRAKPLLGTIVEISIQSEDESVFVAATNAAFARIENIHRAMSFHEATSDLAVIANAPPGATIRLLPDTWNTLSLALEIEAISNGVFNPAIAPVLVRRGVLPSPVTSEFPASSASLAASISLLNEHRIRILKRVWIDLGGIAKGYAVDEAVATLKAHGVSAAVVNAGGDLRVVGDFEHTVAVRLPSNPALVFPIATLDNLSCATTALYFSGAETIVGHRDIGAQKYQSVSVIAPSCAVADALTKIVWLKDARSTEVVASLSHFGAHAALIDGDGQLIRM